MYCEDGENEMIIEGKELETLKKFALGFGIDGEPVNIEQNQSGHINSTYIVSTDKGARYVLQRVNTAVFKNPDELMSNIAGVTDFIRKKLEAEGKDSKRGTLLFHRFEDGKYYFADKTGNAWRLYDYIDGARTYMKAEREGLFYNCAKAFGEFQNMLSDYPADKLYETIPNFHNTESRLEDFKKAVSEDRAGRAKEVKEEIDFILSRSKLCSYVTSRIENGTLPLRVTHNDTKLSNILIDDETFDGICVIDLDTVMPGSVLYDFGDSIRFGACSTEEDEPDTSKVYIKLELFDEFTRGFLDGLASSLTKEEISALPYGALIITLETGMRFLGDYLNGDVYFAVHRDGHNLDRARVQLAMVADMEKHFDEMKEIVKKYAN